MRRDILEKIIDEKIKSVPDLSCIENKSKLLPNPRKTRHAPILKRVLALFLGVLVISGAVLGAVRLLNDGTIGDGQGTSEPTDIHPQMFNYDIRTDKLDYRVGDEITVTWTLRCNSYTKNRFLAEPLFFRLDTDGVFESVGECEHSLENFDPTDYEIGDVIFEQSYRLIITSEFVDSKAVCLEIKGGLLTNETPWDDGAKYYDKFSDVTLADEYQIRNSASFLCNKFGDGVISYAFPSAPGNLHLATHLTRKNGNIVLAFSADYKHELYDSDVTLEGLDLISGIELDGNKMKLEVDHDGVSSVCSAHILVRFDNGGYFERTVCGVVDGNHIFFDTVVDEQSDVEDAVMKSYLLFLDNYNPLRYEYLTTMNRSPNMVSFVNCVMIAAIAILLVVIMHKLVAWIRRSQEKRGYRPVRRSMKRRVIVIFSVAMLCALVFGTFGAYCRGAFIKAPDITEKETETYERFLSLEDDNKADFVNFNKHFIYDIKENISLTVATDLQSEIANYKLECRNFEEVSDITITRESLSFTLRYTGDKDESAKATLTITLADGTEKKLCLYGERRGDALFLGSGESVLIGEGKYVRGYLFSPSTANYIAYLRDYNPIMYEYETTPHTVLATYEILTMCKVAIWCVIATEALYLIVASKSAKANRNPRNISV